MSKETENQSGKETDGGTLHGMFGKTAEMWNTMARTWMENAENLSKMSMNGNGGTIPGMEHLESVFKTWKPVGGMFDKNASDVFLEGMQTVSENMGKLMKANWASIKNGQQQFMRSTGNIRDAIGRHKLEGPGAEMFEVFQDIYQKEVHKFFSIPQLGLTRFYQEKLLKLVDKFNLFQVNMFEFMYVLYMPFMEVMKVMHENIAEVSEKKARPKDFNDYYAIWIKMLEEKYMELFRSTQYINVLSNALQALNEFLAARQAILQDFLKMSGIPGEKEMDELYKDIYALKKRVAVLEKEAGQRPAKSVKK